MARLLILCLTLFLVTASHSDGQTPLTMDPAGGTNSSQSEKNPSYQTNYSQLDEGPIDPAKHIQSNRNFKEQANTRQPGVSLQYQKNYSQEEESLQYQTNNSQPGETLQYQGNNTFPGKRAASPPFQAHSDASLNGSYIETGYKTKLDRQDNIFAYSTNLHENDDVLNIDDSQDKNHSSSRSMSSHMKHDHQTAYIDQPLTRECANTRQPGVSTKQTTNMRHFTDNVMMYVPQIISQTTIPIHPNSTMLHTPVGEGVVWSKHIQYHIQSSHAYYYFVDMAACSSSQLRDIIILLEEAGPMIVIKRPVFGMGNATEIDIDVQFTCKFRVIARHSRYLSAILYDLLLTGGVQARLNVTIAGGKKVQHMHQSVGDKYASSIVFPSTSPELVFIFQLSTGENRTEEDLKDQALTHAEVKFDFLLTKQSGYQLEKGQLQFGVIIHYLTTFAFSSVIHYAHDTNDLVHITATGIVVSFLHFDLQDSPQCQADRLTLSKLQYTTKGVPEYTEIWSQCGSQYIPVQVYDHDLALHFVSDSLHSRTGFKMQYTTHPLSHLPQQLDSGLLNCSVPNYLDFHLHLRCNMVQECVAGEDEVDCPYTSTLCGFGHIHTYEKCFLYVPVRREMTWYDARDLCHRHGERLVTLQYERDMMSFIEVRKKMKTSPIFLSFGLSRFYTEAWFSDDLHLSDDSLAWRHGVNGSNHFSPHCVYSLVMDRPDIPRVTAIPCNRSLYVHFVLCEQENKTTNRPWQEDIKVKKPEWLTVSQSSVHVNLTACNATLLSRQDRPDISVEDGMRFYASEINITSAFDCSLSIVCKKNHFIAVVIEKFDVDMNLSLAGSEEKYTSMYIGPKTSERQYIWSNYTKSDFEHAFVVTSTESNILVHLQSVGGASSIHFQFRCLVSAKPGSKHLSSVNVSPWDGIFTSFAFDGHTRYAHNTFAEGKIPGEVVMISFPHFDLEYDQGCQSDKLSLGLFHANLGLEGAYITEWNKCGREDFSPMVYKYEVRIRFSTGSTQAATGFKMLFSMPSQLPQQSHSGLFNCSVSNYPEIQHHLHCNLERECVAGEDEEDCPYTSTDCGSDHIDADNKCYMYLPVRREMMWYDASQLCQSHGERLVSPGTPSEWNTFRTITDYGKKTFGVFVGLSTSPSSLQAMYREVWQWEDKTLAFYINLHGQKLSKSTCAYLPPIYRDMLEPIRCEDQIYVHYVLCEKDKPPVNGSHMQVKLSDLSNTVWPNNFLHCPEDHVTHSFLSCDLHAKCGVTKYMLSCPLSGGDSVPMFECDGGSGTVHYSLVCDHRQDCADASDEKWCQHAPCGPLHQPCKNQQCVLQSDWCDGMRHCVDGKDENCLQFVHTMVPSVPPPAVVSLDGYGGYRIRALAPTEHCPVTHFRCSPRDYCLPIYLRCNDVFDCPGHEDEEQCDSYMCPNFYRCLASSVCVHSHHVCDGVFQCPQQDDEWLCNVTCPQGCRCQGLAFTCNQTFPVHTFPSLRYLDASDSGMKPRDLVKNHYLVRLCLSRCELTSVDSITLPNLMWLDLSANTLTTVNMQTFAGLKKLRVLHLAQNPLTSLVPNEMDTQHLSLHMLDLSLTELVTYHGESLTGFSSLTYLNISHGALTSISEQGLNSTPRLQVLDVRGSPLDDFPQHLLRDLVSIHTVYTENFKLCCPAMLPNGFNPKNCHAPLDEIASCEDLLRSNAYRVSLWFMMVMAVVGNAGSFVYRVWWREANKTGFHVFVSNLCLADFLMGLYLAVIGAADAVYRGEYLWNDKLWKDSAACQMAGFLSLLSSEMSAFFICLITLDRFIVLRFPFSQVRFHIRSALVTSALVWTGGCFLALVPLLPMTSHWRFYSQTGICIPLPITRATFKGWAYSFAVMVVFNFVLFVLITLGQLLIFLSVRINSMTGSHSEQDAIIARRLTTIVLTDFLCWFPIGLLGLLACTGTPISSELNVGMAIFVLPFNSALNPFLYTVNVILEKRRKAAEARLLETLKRQAASQ